MTEDLLRRLDDMAVEEQRSRSNLIVKLLEDELAVRESRGNYGAKKKRKKP